MSKDFYGILGVSKTASDAEIKQAYRKLSRELHPDKHKGDKQKEAKFKEVNEAYEVLSDAKKKAAYDQFGNADFAQGGGFGGFSGFQGFDPSQFQDMGGFGDIFETFFTGGGGSNRRQSDRRGRDLETEMVINLQEAVKGVERSLSFETNIRCEDCDARGHEKGSSMKQCSTCHGEGHVMKRVRSLFGVMEQRVLCETCRGDGTVPEKPCSKCHGEGRKRGTRTVTVRIPAGIDDGQTLRLKEEGDIGRQGKSTGDLLVHIRVKPHDQFTREGDTIRSGIEIDVIHAVLGGETTIDTVHGPTTIEIPAGIQPDQILRIKGKGMPVLNTHRHGDHLVTVSIRIPTHLTKEERKLYEELRKKG